jgi:hypothetical protein
MLDQSNGREATVTIATLTTSDVLIFLVERAPGRTDTELAEAIYGSGAYQQNVNEDCRMLADAGKLARRGRGVPDDPFRYFPL